MPSCVSWNSPDRKISVEPTMVSSIGLLKLYVKFVSTRNSPVNAFVSSGDSFVREAPLSQLKSANANGSGVFGVSDAGCADADCADADEGGSVVGASRASTRGAERESVRTNETMTGAACGRLRIPPT